MIMEVNKDILMVVDILRQARKNGDIKSYVLIVNNSDTALVSRSGNYDDIFESFVQAFSDDSNMLKQFALAAIQEQEGGLL